MLVDVEAPDDRFAAALHHQPGQDVDQRRFGMPLGPSRPNLSARNIEADIVKRALPAGIGFREDSIRIAASERLIQAA